MREVKISGTRFKVVSYDVIPGQTTFELPNKKSMAYQFLVGYRTFDDLRRYSTAGVHKIEDPKGFKHVIGLELSKTKCEPQNYEQEDLGLIFTCLAGMPMYFLEAVEALVLATKDRDFISLFYKTYGDEGIVGFKKECIKLAQDKLWRPNEKVDAMYPRAYKKGKRYSVYQLLKDLVEDKAKILTDPELVGGYERITASKTEKPEEVIPVEDQWQEINNLVGNKTRANLSLQFTSFVDIDVPENEVGVKPGVRRNLECIKTFSIVRDGVLNMDLLAVRVSKKLAHKLRAVGCIRMNLIYKNSLLLDLTTIPVISKGDLIKFDSVQLGAVELDYVISGMAIDYLSVKKNASYVKPSGKKNKNLSPEEKYLRSLGIFEDKYYPQKEVGVREGRSYLTTELLTSIEGFPADPAAMFTAAKEYARTGTIPSRLVRGSDKRENLKWMLENIDKLQWDLEAWKNLNRDSRSKLRDMKFQMIMSKVANFNEYHKPSITKKKARLELFGNPDRKVDIKWRFKDTKINV